MTKEALETPSEGSEVMLNYWWWEKDGQILDYVMNGQHCAQANKSKAVMDHMVEHGHKLYANHTPMLIPVAYYPRSR